MRCGISIRSGFSPRRVPSIVQPVALASSRALVTLAPLEGFLHQRTDLDTLGLTPDSTYTLDVFHAERCGSGSNFRIDTSISCFVPQ